MIDIEQEIADLDKKLGGKTPLSVEVVTLWAIWAIAEQLKRIADLLEATTAKDGAVKVWTKANGPE